MIRDQLWLPFSLILECPEEALQEKMPDVDCRQKYPDVSALQGIARAGGMPHNVGASIKQQRRCSQVKKETKQLESRQISTKQQGGGPVYHDIQAVAYSMQARQIRAAPSQPTRKPSKRQAPFAPVAHLQNCTALACKYCLSFITRSKHWVASPVKEEGTIGTL